MRTGPASTHVRSVNRRLVIMPGLWPVEGSEGGESGDRKARSRKGSRRVRVGRGRQIDGRAGNGGLAGHGQLFERGRGDVKSEDKRERGL